MIAKVEWIAHRAKWYIVDRHPSHPSGRRTQALGGSEADQARGQALADAINAERAEQRGRALAVELRGPLMGDLLLRAWWDVAQAGLADSTRETNEALLLRLAPHFAATDVRRLTPEDVRGFGGAMADAGLGQHSVHNALSLLRRAIHWAVDQGALERIPVRRICELGVRAAAARGATKGQRQAWTRDEAAVLLELAGARPRLHAVVFAAQQSGARKGELLALRWEDVNLAERRITWGGSRGRKATRAKSTKANKARTVDLAPELAVALGQLARASVLRPAGDDFVFRDRRGKPWNYDGLDSAWDRLRRRAQVRGVRPLPFHSWRHTYVSWALAAGEDLAWIARQIGDRIDTMTRNYAHLLAGTGSDHAFLSVQGTPARLLHPAATAGPAPAAPAVAGARRPRPGARARPRAGSASASRPSAPAAPPSGSSGR